MSELPYTIVIPTTGTHAELDRVFRSLYRQSRPPESVILVDSSDQSQTGPLLRRWKADLLIQHTAATVKGAAAQRNQGLSLVKTPLVLFLDDDTELPTEGTKELLAPFAEPLTAGVAGMTQDPTPLPSRWTRSYHQLQAGYEAPHYGARLFGPAINVFPVAEQAAREPLVRADWLNSACLMVRASMFPGFPDFPGYSAYEDVHSTARMAAAGALYFHTRVSCAHHDNRARSVVEECGRIRARFRNQAITARQTLGMKNPELTAKMTAHRAFLTAHLLRNLPEGWMRKVAAVWGM